MQSEGSIEIGLDKPEKISKSLEVFYNPVMKVNRDITIAFLNSVGKEGMKIADPMAGSGIRAIRIFKELSFKAEIYANDYDEKSVNFIKKLAEKYSCILNISKKDANEFLLENTPFDYVDIDPFGTPNPFLVAAIYSTRKDGFLAVTATDTSALSGTYPDSCKRKYWATSLRSEVMHETALRILARKVQLLGIQYNNALIPIYSFSTDHYVRLYFKIIRGKKEAVKVFDQHKMMFFCSKCHFMGFSSSDSCENYCSFCKSKLNHSGPMYIGGLWDKDIAEKMYIFSKEENYLSSESKKIIYEIYQESRDEIPLFYHIHKLWKLHNIKTQHKINVILENLRKKGFKATRTHINKYGIRTDANLKELIYILKN